ncbi:fimbria/pilus periplasmic chaperone [uncultured Vibrio sp.]|uniref:fimbrial biogenesis chaperone n=1 Tax=uncultured Vibrio sp. TaxID=114054 RepID=UPI002AA92BDF|nr:fimbria/pilus periplasmic chaperone [uncultured Vibrio sp.]
MLLIISRKTLSLLATLLLPVLLASNASASLLISPTRVTFAERDRSTKVFLMNTSSETKTYRLEFQQQRQLPNGLYQSLSESELVGFNTASHMLRFSPRQVTLKPGERQQVRIAVRRPKDLAPGEHRSHLLLAALPGSKDRRQTEGVGLQLNLRLSFSIPVIVRVGGLDAAAEFGPVKLYRDAGSAKPDGVTFAINRSGLHSTFGSLKAFWRPHDSGEERQVATLNNVAVFHENKQRLVRLPFHDPIAQDGTLRLIYEGDDEFGGRVLAEQQQTISDYQLTP